MANRQEFSGERPSPLPAAVGTFVFIQGNVVYTRSDAALARHLRLPWRVLRILRPVPRPLRDWVYDLVARGRYRYFRKRDNCWLPTVELRSRFVE